MNCSEAGARMGAYADEELPRSIRQEVEAHIAECPVCGREAGRLTANLAFMKRTMSRLAAGEDLSTDFLAEEDFQKKAINYFPQVDALAGTTAALHEYYGMIAYELLGWI